MEAACARKVICSPTRLSDWRQQFASHNIFPGEATLSNTSSDPNQPAERWANIGDLRVRCLDWGGDGPPVVALHGLASSAHWYDLVSPLLRHTYRVIAPDQRGHGQTTQAPDGYDWASLSLDVIGLMDSLDIERFAVLGHSWGGNVAINLAAKHPDRISALVMIDGGFFGGRSRVTSNYEEFRQRAAPRDVSGTLQELMDRFSKQLSLCWNPDIERIVQTMVWEDEDGQMHDILTPENHSQVMHAMWHEPASEAWPHITCPTLIVAAGPTPERADSPMAQMKRERVAAAHEAIAGSQVHWVPETIHDIGYHKPNELAEVIDEFLSGVRS
tara:strand:+ start:3172 stop:4158 length:987 start_codon:yes stop_codon:yes gene_type:complete